MHAVVLFLGLGLPNLLITLLKMFNLVKDLRLARLNHYVITDNLSFNLWPKGREGKRIGLAMTVLLFLLHAIPGIFLMASPKPATDWMHKLYNTANSTAFDEWTSKTGDRLQLQSIFFLVIGLIAFVLAICLILFEDTWVAKIVAKFPNQPKEEDNVEEAGSDLKSPGEDQDAGEVTKEKKRISSELVCK